MRGPQIMRNILQLVADKVCCYMSLSPNRKVKGTTLTARQFSRSRITLKHDRCLGAPYPELASIYVGKAKRIQAISCTLYMDQVPGAEVRGMSVIAHSFDVNGIGAHLLQILTAPPCRELTVSGFVFCSTAFWDITAQTLHAKYMIRARCRCKAPVVRLKM